jgi:hypothetical protein
MADEKNTVRALCVLSPRLSIHGHQILPGHVVVRVTDVLVSPLKPVAPGGPDDEDVVANGYYQWPITKLFLL